MWLKKSGLRMFALLKVSTILALMAFIPAAANLRAQDKETEQELTSPILVKIVSTAGFESIFKDDFENGIDHWELAGGSWKHMASGRSKVLSLHQKKSNYKPVHRSPLHLALLKEHEVSSFDLKLRIQSTHEDYNHRDVCLFFGYQSPTEFYYLHLGKKTDPHCNQVFIVNNADRVKISITTNDGTGWDRHWHSVRLLRDVVTGEIQVFFDDMAKPVMTAKDKTFTHGRIGVGSFDDTANFDNLQLSGIPYTPASDDKTD